MRATYHIPHYIYIYLDRGGRNNEASCNEIMEHQGGWVESTESEMVGCGERSGGVMECVVWRGKHRLYQRETNQEERETMWEED